MNELQAFLERDDTWYRLDADDCTLPCWFVILLNKLPDRCLLVHHKDGQFMLQEEAGKELQVQLLQNEKDIPGIAILYNQPKDITLPAILPDDFIIPDSFQFLNTALSSLDCSFSLFLYPAGDRNYVLENYVICYSERLVIIPDILSLDQVRLLYRRADQAYSFTLTGSFTIDKTFSLLASLTWQINQQISVSIYAQDGTFPSLITFLTWAAKEVSIAEAFSWLSEDTTLLDAAISSASLVLDTRTCRVVDVIVTCKLTLWQLDFQIRFCLADKMISGSLWQDQPLRISELLKKIATSEIIDSSIADFSITACNLQLALAEERYTLQCSLSDIWHIGSFALQDLTFTLTYQKDAGFSFQVSGILDLGNQKLIMLSGSYDAASEGWTFHGEVTLGNGISLLDVLQYLKAISPALVVPDFLSCISLIAFSFDYHSLASHIEIAVEGKASLPEEINLKSVPFIKDILPAPITYDDGTLSFVYQEGRILKGEITLSYTNVEATQKPVETPIERPVVLEENHEYQGTKAVGVVSSDEGVRWFAIQKQVGPASLKRVGLSFHDGLLAIGLDAGMMFGPVDVEMIGLTLGYDLAKQTFHGDIKGLSLRYATSSFTLEGGFYHQTNSSPTVKLQLGGSLLIKMQKWQLQGIVSYVQMKNNDYSLFAFVNCQMALAGTPAFTITGIMGGFCVNRKIILPEVTEVEKFPLLTMDGKKSGMDILAELEPVDPVAKHWMCVSKNDYMAAIGMQFTAFELVQGKLLLTLLFGNELQVGLLGSAELTLPKGSQKEHAYAYVKLLLSAVLQPEQGVFSINAALSNDSYLLSKDCHVSGGAAFYTWFGTNQHAGDFVVTVGGYHPAFQIPVHYPNVTRVGFHWQVSSCISAKGEAYMALTPACIMAGGALEFIFETGGLRAWFTAYADLIMNWHPFYFDAAIGIEVGVSYRLNLGILHKTIKVALGASLQLWGPPIGGIVSVDLYILSFDIAFGKSATAIVKKLDWQQFSELLPQPQELQRFTPSIGVYPSTQQDHLWVCKTAQFSCQLETAIPLGQINIRPMCLEDVVSTSQVRLRSPAGEEVPLSASGFTMEPLYNQLPEAMWGRIQDHSVPSAALLYDMQNGYAIHSPAPCYGAWADIVNYQEALITCLKLINPLTLEGNEATGVFDPEEDESVLQELEAISSEVMQLKRQDTVNALQLYYQGSAGSFSLMSDERYHLFKDRPMIVKRRT